MEFKEETPCLHGLTGVGTPALRATAGAAVDAGLSETPPSLRPAERSPLPSTATAMAIPHPHTSGCCSRRHTLRHHFHSSTSFVPEEPNVYFSSDTQNHLLLNTACHF